MYPDSALSAGQLAVMAVVVAVSLAAWRPWAARSRPRHQAAMPDQRYRPSSQRAMLR